MQKEGQQYQYLMADEYFLENNSNYSSFQLGDIQFFVNLKDFEAPIFQPSKIHNPYVSLIGNYCISDSSITVINKVDPLFVAIRVLRNKFVNEQQKSSIEFENIFNNEDSFELYLSKYKYLKEKIDFISNTTKIDDELYVRLNKEKLFQFLDIKYNNIHQYSQSSVYLVDDFNQKKQDNYEVETCDLFKQYIGDQLYLEYKAKKKAIIAERSQKFEIPIGSMEKQNFQVEKQSQPQKKSQSIKQKQSDLKNAKAAKNCCKIDSFIPNNNQKTQQDK